LFISCAFARFTALFTASCFAEQPSELKTQEQTFAYHLGVYSGSLSNLYSNMKFLQADIIFIIIIIITTNTRSNNINTTCRPRSHGTIPPVPHTSSWSVIQISTRKKSCAFTSGIGYKMRTN
jgi:hypothetical protein